MRTTSPQTVDDALADVVRLVQEHLGLDVTCVNEFRDGRLVCTAVAGDAGSFGLRLQDGPPLHDAYCARVVTGELPPVVPDSGLDLRVADLPATRAGVGAYVGVPLHLPDGSLYGSLCALSRSPRPDLGERHRHALALLSELVVSRLAAMWPGSAQRDALRGVLAAGTVTMAMQPVVDLQSGRTLTLEALARFPPALGSPDTAFDVAARAGRREELERLALTAALRAQHDLPDGTVLAVNLSPDVACRFADDAPPDLPCDRLVLELTEHKGIGSYADVRECLQPLRDRGLQLAIDDTGAGFSSLRHVVELRPDVIKVDRSLIAGIDQDRARRTVLTTFVLLALDLGAVVVAEGVETPEELRTAAGLGVDAVQGYLLARPTTDPRAWARWLDRPLLVPDRA